MLAVLVGLELQPVVRILGVELVEQVDRPVRVEELADDRGEPDVAPAIQERRLTASRPDDPQQPGGPVGAAEDELAAGVLDLALDDCGVFGVARRERRGDLPPHRAQPLRGRRHLRHLLAREEAL